VGPCDLNIPPYRPEAITTIWNWLVQLNTQEFAGYSDWRIPEVNKNGGAEELETIRREPCSSYDPIPCVDSVFHNACTEGCTVTTCSCTALDGYWSSIPSDASTAHSINFANGAFHHSHKTVIGNQVRAVRGGLTASPTAVFLDVTSGVLD